MTRTDNGASIRPSSKPPTAPGTRVLDPSRPLITSHRLAIFAATSGHSGVDRVIRNLTFQLDAWGIGVDLLRIRNHGPELDMDALVHARRIDLGADHVNTALPALVRWLRRERPAALLTDKDRVNRIAIVARHLAAVDTRLCVRLGTTVSVNLSDRGGVERLLQRWSIRHLYPHADGVIVPSQGVADDLTHYTGLPHDQIHVVRSPIVTPQLDVLAAAPCDHPWLASDQPPVILGVGELSYRKDFATLVRAVARVRRKRECRLIILGRGRRQAELQALAEQLGIGSDMHLPGFTPNPYSFMSRAAVFVLSSRWEGMPVALVEALACGTPAVATDCPSGPAELLGDGDCGSLVSIGDEAAMATKIDHWLECRPQPALIEQAIAPYRIEASAAAFLARLGFDNVATCVTPTTTTC
ncbi:glycosyltransferase [Thioflavicoccus mobilis 8321]|uniref:Glycosyltransferase n=1 Tax=Thioflavicoccus mobilis 8321 TaxID=765912 RepID=L0GY27_9GAMM|nr:glycosyltransferase [Thioflavicoccus mobilis 8321]